MRVGRTVEPFTAEEVPDADKAPILRAYLKAWAWEVGRFFEGLSADSSDADLQAAAAGLPGLPRQLAVSPLPGEDLRMSPVAI